MSQANSVRESLDICMLVKSKNSKKLHIFDLIQFKRYNIIEG